MQERAALAREQREGQAIKNAVARKEYAPIGLLADVLGMASSAVVDRFDQLEGTLKKACPDLPDEAKTTVQQVIAEARNEWVRSTAKLVDDSLDAMLIEDENQDDDAAGGHAMNSPVELLQHAASGENVTLPQYLARKLLSAANDGEDPAAALGLALAQQVRLRNAALVDAARCWRQMGAAHGKLLTAWRMPLGVLSAPCCCIACRASPASYAPRVGAVAGLPSTRRPDAQVTAQAELVLVLCRHRDRAPVLTEDLGTRGIVIKESTG